MMNRWQKLASAVILGGSMALGGPGSAVAQTKPEGEMRYALYVTVTPALLDPGEAVLGNLTPFWMLYALHDALIKPMPRSLTWRDVRRTGCDLTVSLVATEQADTTNTIGLSAALPTAKSLSHLTFSVPLIFCH